MKREDIPCKCVNMRQWFAVKDGHYTVARMDQDNGEYSILAGECDSAEGPILLEHICGPDLRIFLPGNEN